VPHETPTYSVERAERREKRPVVVAGTGAPAGTAEACEAAGVPLLADPLSGARRGGAAIAHYDAFLRKARPELEPDCIVRLGDLPTSKPLRQWLQNQDVPQLSTDLRQDPTASVTQLIHSMPQFTAPEPGWLGTWTSIDQRTARAIDTVLGEELSEPNVVRAVASGADTLVVASSMPIRDLETFGAVPSGATFSNRGANGIDGTVSTAYGIAAASGRPVTCLIGDVAFAYDIGGLMTAVRHPELDVAFVVIHNDGGGIFEFLPVATEADHFEEHVATPHGLDFAHAAALYGLPYTEAETLQEVEHPHGIVVVRTDREDNVVLHRAVWDAV